MQLIKNVFLTREKTVSRKLEEILLVYILENNRIVSRRMLEVYFNIIEWGPNVYGIGEASRFYFQKSPSELTFNECLFWLESSQAQENSCINLMTRAS
jgi:membrane peptidoglycan carboxypeptidase